MSVGYDGLLFRERFGCSVVCDLHLNIVTGLEAKQPEIGLRFPVCAWGFVFTSLPRLTLKLARSLCKGLIGCSLEVTAYLSLVPEAKKERSHTSISSFSSGT